MDKQTTSKTGSYQTMRRIRQKIERGGERLWRYEDFHGFSFPAVAQALSRLSRQGELERLSKGIYYRARKTAIGKSLPNPAVMKNLAEKDNTIFPAGIAAANMLGFSTQTTKRAEVATTGLSLPRKLLGEDVIIHTRRPANWSGLSQEDAALLDFLRQSGKTSELSAAETTQRVLALFKVQDRFMHLLSIADTEPPRVRAMLGAIGEELGQGAKHLKALRASLNPLSRFDFGLLSSLSYAMKWQAKGS